MQCTKCGKELIDGARFCGHCGADQTAVQQPVQPTQQVPMPKKPQQKAPKQPRQKAPKKPVNKAALIVWIVSGVLILAAIVMVLAFVVFPDGLHFGDNKTSASYEREDRDDDRDEEDERDDEDDAVDTASDDAAEEPFEDPVEEADEEPVEEPSVGLTFSDDMIIGVILPSDKDAAMMDAFTNGMEERGGALILYTSEYDPAKEASQIQNLIAQGVDAIILLPVGEIPVAALLNAQEAGVAVIVSSGMTDSGYYTVTHDPAALGEMAAGYANDKVYLMNATPEGEYFINMEMSASDWINNAGGELVGIGYSMFDPERGMDTTENALIDFPDMDTMICFDPVSANGVYQTLDAGNFGGAFIAFVTEQELNETDMLYGNFDTVLLYFDSGAIANTFLDTAAKIINGIAVDMVTYVSPNVETSY